MTPDLTPDGSETGFTPHVGQLANRLLEIFAMPKQFSHEAAVGKPPKPTPDFPLYAHATRRWAKKIHGKLHYFGPWDDPTCALDRYLAQKDYLLNGRAVPSTLDGITTRDVVNAFLTAKQRKVDAGELTVKSFADYYRIGELLVPTLGYRLVTDLTPDDFARLRASMARRLGRVALANEIQRIRSIFKYAFEADLIKIPVKFGPEFVKPSRKEMRLARHARPKRMLSSKEIRTLLKLASPQMKAMILLGVNCGMGNTDVSELTAGALDLKSSIADYPRGKTGIERRAPLWPETVKAIRKAMKDRPDPLDISDADLVFLTKYGRPWVRIDHAEPEATGKLRFLRVDGVSREFGKLMVKAGLSRGGVGFYALRHVFETIAGETGDQPAVDRIMGHEDGESMSVRYREWLKDRREDARLRAVTNHVRAWLFGNRLQEKRSAHRVPPAA